MRRRRRRMPILGYHWVGYRRHGVGHQRHGVRDISQFGLRSLLLLGHLQEETSFVWTCCVPDLAALLVEGRCLRHQDIWHNNIGPKQGRQQSCVLANRPLAAPQASATCQKVSPRLLSMNIVNDSYRSRACSDVYCPSVVRLMMRL